MKRVMLGVLAIGIGSLGFLGFSVLVRNEFVGTRWEEMARIPAVPAFSAIATPEVVDGAVEGFIGSFMMGDEAWHRLDWANKWLRHEVFARQLGAGWYGRMYAAQMGRGYASPATLYAVIGGEERGIPYQPELVGWRRRVMEVARDYLRDPDRLEATYRRLKSPLIAAIKSDRRTYTSAKARLEGDIIPFFQVPRPLAMEQVVATLSAADNYDLSNAERRKQAACKWMLRRQAEGGDALVAAWGRVFADIARSL